MGELNGKDTASVVELQKIGVESFGILHLHAGSRLAIISLNFVIASDFASNVPNAGSATLMALIASIFSVIVMLQKFVPIRALLMCFCGGLYLFGSSLSPY